MPSPNGELLEDCILFTVISPHKARPGSTAGAQEIFVEGEKEERQGKKEENRKANRMPSGKRFPLAHSKGKSAGDACRGMLGMDMESWAPLPC